jgi:hypothetical protein
MVVLLQEALARYLEHPEISRREHRHLPLAATWLNGRTWEDEVCQPVPATATTRRPVVIGFDAGCLR